MPKGLEERWVAALEVALGRKLPASYRREMQRENGGTVVAGEEHWELHPISDGTSPSTIARTYPDVVQETEADRRWSSFPTSALTIAANASGDRLILLVGGKGSFGPVVLRWDHETGHVLPVAEDFAELRANPLPPPQRRDLPPLYQPTRGRRVASLSVPGGPVLEQVPKPWRSIAPAQERGAMFRLQLGKKSGCWVDLHARALGDLEPEREWRAFTGLRVEGPLQTEAEALEVVEHQLRLTWAWSSRWLPVLGWIQPADDVWYGQFFSETRRLAGDLREIRRLLAAFEFADPAQADLE